MYRRKIFRSSMASGREQEEEDHLQISSDDVDEATLWEPQPPPCCSSSTTHQPSITMAFKIGEPVMLLWQPDENNWHVDRYTSDDWWITDVTEFDGCFLAVTSDGRVAKIDLSAPPGYGRTSLMETEGYREGEMISHVFDVESDRDVGMIMLVASGRDIVDLQFW